jgi:hypothetical protein
MAFSQFKYVTMNRIARVTLRWGSQSQMKGGGISLYIGDTVYGNLERRGEIGTVSSTSYPPLSCRERVMLVEDARSRLPRYQLADARPVSSDVTNITNRRKAGLLLPYAGRG